MQDAKDSSGQITPAVQANPPSAGTKRKYRRHPKVRFYPQLKELSSNASNSHADRLSNRPMKMLLKDPHQHMLSSRIVSASLGVARKTQIRTDHA
jgi:hypothetical protein